MKVRRSERLVDMTQYLLEHPHELISLTSFAERYESAKSSISEDLAIIKKTFRERGYGILETLPGAAGGVLFIPEISYEEAKKYLEFMKAVDAHYMNMQGVMWTDTPYQRPTNKEQILSYARLSDKIGRLCKEYGVKACMHPHANTAVFTKEQIDLYMENTNPEYVFLCIDTAHTTLAGIDAPELVREYGKRIGYMHLKDIDPDETLNTEWPMKRFRPLGCGCVNFKGVVNELRNAGYDDILCVELDYQPVCNYRSAQISREYIHNVLGL